MNQQEFFEKSRAEVKINNGSTTECCAESWREGFEAMRRLVSDAVDSCTCSSDFNDRIDTIVGMEFEIFDFELMKQMREIKKDGE